MTGLPITLELIRAISTVQSSVDDYSLRAPTGTDLFLDPTAVVDGTGTEASPWNTFTNAKVSTLSAGQILWIKNGTFNWASLTSLNSGNASNRIKIAAYPGHSPVATLSSSTVGFDSCYGFGKAGGVASYWDIVGLRFNLAGRVGIMFGANQWNNPTLSCSYVRVIDCIGNTTLAASDNGGILFFDAGAEDVQVIRGQYTATGATGGSGTNRALIWADYQKNLQIVGTLLNATGTSLPFYYKHTNLQTSPQVSRIFRNNIVRGGSRGTLFCGKYFLVLNNVFDGVFVDFGDQGGGDAGRGSNILLHNTFYNANIGFTINGTGGENYDNYFRNNLIAGTSQLWDNPYAATDFRTLSSHNTYRTGSAIVRNSTSYALAAYQSAFPTRERNSLSGTITFAGAASDTPSDWALTAGSAGDNAADDGTDAGVNTSLLLTTNSITEVAPDLEINWGAYADQAAVTAAPWANAQKTYANQGDADYTFWGNSTTGGLELVAATGPNGHTKVLRQNFAIGSVGFSSPGITIAYPTGYETEIWYEVYRRVSTTFTPQGTGVDNPDYKAIFLSTQDGPGSTGAINGRASLKYGNNGAMNNLYYTMNSQPSDLVYNETSYDINDGNWFRQRYHMKIDAAGGAILAVEHWNLTGTPTFSQQVGWSSPANVVASAYMLLGANRNKPATQEMYIDTERIRIWTGSGAGDPGWGF